ncbi:MAG: thioredoxin domain-containing protein [Brumimicrobium sp.]
MDSNKHTNDLIHSNSPYLLQHAHNPVNWVEWSENAFKKAKTEDKLVLVSIGYSACHWCHVMEHESFEDESVAKLMNDNFICIKVDREERPDVDQVYMNAVQLMTQQGGWPLNCFALADGRPIYGGTYFPKEQWINVLKSLHETYVNDKPKVLEYAGKLTEGVQQSELIEKSKVNEVFDKSKIDLLIQKWKQNFDFDNGGSKRAPKFPLPNNVEFLLRYAYQKNDSTVRNHVRLTLEKMAFGGIYDQLGGGFSRYSVDMLWKVPHFEKMLYDNGQLLSLYAQAYQFEKNPLYASVVEETIEWLTREMKDEEGGFYAALDADSEGVEGKYYTWSKGELKSILDNDFEWFSELYNVNELGYWEENQYILMRTSTIEDFAKKYGFKINEFEKILTETKNKLLKVRGKRIKPGLDDKKITSWNAMTIKGLALSGLALNNQKYISKAKAAGEWIVKHQMKNDDSLWRTRKGSVSKINGFLEDYAHTIDAFLTLYEVTFDERWLTKAMALLKYCQANFQDFETKMFYFTEKNTELVARKTEVNDNVIPASNSVMGNNLFKLGKLFRDEILISEAKQMLSNMYEYMPQYGSGYSNWALLALNFNEQFYEVAVMGEDALNQNLKLGEEYIPNKIIAGGKSSPLPFLHDKPTKSETLIYVCVDYACKAPVQEVQSAIQEIRKE